VKVILKDYPLDPECNPNVATATHEAACEGAVAVRLAERRQRGAAMEEWLYTHKAGLTRTAVRQAAEEIGGVTDFDAEYPRTLALVRNDVALAQRIGVKGTPTFFVNGVRMDGAVEPRMLEQAIAHELRVRAPRP
jgi:protein-disulfide isomerase